MSRKKPKIFLSYAHEDIGMAKKLYQDLNRYGLDIWFDTESLEVGELWETAILDAIEQSDYFIAVLSSNSMTKKGYVQKELKTALKVVDLFPEDTIYIMPVRIDDCLVKNRKLKKHHWIDVFPESEYQKGLNRILQVISPDTFTIRNKPTELSSADVHDMLKTHGYYDRDRNPAGKGVDHQYSVQKINGDKVLVDKATGLMWQQGGSLKAMKYENAKYWINKLNQQGYAGFYDWRLPTLEEAMSLMEPEQKTGNLYIDPFFDTKQDWIWTVDQVKGESQAAWVVYFGSGDCGWDAFEDYNSVRAVRSGQSSK